MPSVTRPAASVAIPLRNEARDVGRCIAALDRAAARFGSRVRVVVLANNCTDGSLDRLSGLRPRHLELEVRAITLRPGFSHVGWARRLALDAAAEGLAHPDDMLLSTDADTEVDPRWLLRSAAHLEGCDAVAGRAFTRREARAALGAVARARLDLLTRYFVAVDHLRATLMPDPHDPWPRHFYEGGASIALRLGTYRAIGGAPTPPVAEDRALFAAIRAHGGRVRHPLDVRVFTSPRLDGRAAGGMADTVRRWVEQDADAPLHECWDVEAALSPGPHGADRQLSFRRLPGELARAQAMIRAARAPAALTA